MTHQQRRLKDKGGEDSSPLLHTRWSVGAFGSGSATLRSRIRYEYEAKHPSRARRLGRDQERWQPRTRRSDRDECRARHASPSEVVQSDREQRHAIRPGRSGRSVAHGAGACWRVHGTGSTPLFRPVSPARGAMGWRWASRRAGHATGPRRCRVGTPTAVDLVFKKVRQSRKVAIVAWASTSSSRRPFGTDDVSHEDHCRP